jgi:NAD(P)H-nitrite reductase large subunit
VKIVIAGAGPAGATVAETLRDRGDGADIVMISREPYPPYSPPAMLEYFSTGHEVHFWKGRDFTERLGLDYRPGAEVEAVNTSERTVRLSNGETHLYDRLVLATGGRLYAPLEGETKPGVYNFKSLSAAEELFQRVRDGTARSALIVGAGFVGVEIGLVLADMGLEVTQLVRSRVMRTMLDPETAEIVCGLMEQRGVKVLRGDDADAVAFAGEPRATAVRTRSGKELEADLLVAATGIRPNIDFLEGSGIETDWGVLVDDHLRASVPDVYAAGDVAQTTNRLTGERLVIPNYPNAEAQGTVVAHNLLGLDSAYEGADAMNSLKHLGVPLIAAGQMDGEELRVKRGDNLRKIFVEDGCIVGFRLYGDISAAGILRSLMNRRVDVSTFKGRLLEPRFGLGYLQGLAPWQL